VTTRFASRVAVRSGFTLIEMIVGVGLLTLMSALTYGIIASFFRVQRDTDDLVDTNHMARVVLSRMQRDVSQAFLSLNQGIEERTKVVFLGERDRIVLATMGNVPITVGAAETDQGVVEYHLGPNSDDREGRDLLRRFERVIDDSPESGGDEVVIASGVKEFRLEYWDEEGAEWDDSWKADDPLASAAPGYTLPYRIKIHLVLVDAHEEEYVFETQTPIYMMKPLLFGQPISATAQQYRAGQQLDKAVEQTKHGQLPTGTLP
jgi:type II secretion system protein J